MAKPKPIRVRWNGSNEAQRQSDQAWNDFKLNQAKKRKAEKALARRRQYEDYINSRAWQENRRQAFRHYGRKCQQCGRSDLVLNVHHLTYQRFGHEKMRDLKILCDDCHKVLHGRTDDSLSKEFRQMFE